MANRTCSVDDDCSKDGRLRRGLCGKHYENWRRCGNPRGSRSPVTAADMEERFFSHVRKDPCGCWVWTGSITRDGYGMFGDGAGKVVGAHRWAYEHFVEEIPDGLQIDHLCHTRERLTCPGGRTCPHRRCVNPAHMQPVPQKVNAERGVNQKYDDEEYAALYGRWRAGESQVALAAESRISQAQLSRAFQRITRDAPSLDGLLF